MKEQQEIRVFGLAKADIPRLQQIAQQRYGKASVSLLAKKLLQEQIRQPENFIEPHQQENIENQRITLRLPPMQYFYLAQKAELQHSSLNDTVRNIISEYITKNPYIKQCRGAGNLSIKFPAPTHRAQSQPNCQTIEQF